ncbi:MAG TPA: hypothetical protein VFH95_14345 [Candidatus Kapabacteria bacterium]|nr:hypothetical protein [Candidatus Kapabacteria bacterium]
MKAYPIEDTIIAYFDGRLNDSEGAELLHRVSVSPEIREIFEAHDALRQMAVRAAQNISISPELEEAVFARIAALQEEERLPVGFWTLRRIAVTAGVAAILIAGVAGSFEFQNAGANSAESGKIKNQGISIQHMAANARFETAQRTFEPAYRTAIEQVNSEIPGDNLTTTNDISLIVGDPSSAITMHPAPEESEVASIPLPSISHATFQSLRELPPADAESKFEAGISSPMSGFSFPGSVPQQGPFADVTIRAAYNLDEKNQVGLRITDGSFAGLRPAAGAGYTHETMELQQGYAGELFYRHREPVVQGLFFVTGGAGGGFYSLGTMLSAELGIEVPFGERLLGGVSLIVSRLHQNGSESAILSSSTPVIYDGSNVFNSLNGSIEYALTYRF